MIHGETTDKCERELDHDRRDVEAAEPQQRVGANRALTPPPARTAGRGRRARDRRA